MASWDSIYSLDQKVKVRGTGKSLPLCARIIYDTPCAVSYSICVDANDAIRAKVLKGELEDDIQLLELKGWYREAGTIDARGMGDQDVYDIFSKWIENYMKKISSEGITVQYLEKMYRQQI